MRTVYEVIWTAIFWLGDKVKQIRHRDKLRRNQAREDDLREAVNREIETRQREHAISKHDVPENPYEAKDE